MSNDSTDSVTITVLKDGPYEVRGDVPIARQTIVANEAGESVDWSEGETLDHKDPCYLCRCGHSNNKPFCDGSHKKVGFDGTETAGHEPYEDGAEVVDGPVVSLQDNTSLCAVARFCDVGDQIWNLVQSDDPGDVDQAVQQGTMCPSGRLVVRDNETGRAHEPDLEPSIGIIDDPAAGVGGPIWVRGGITVVDADGQEYEVRNRVTLCRCGESLNKPFCDATHSTINFQG